MILYDHPASGNAMKPRILLRQLSIPFERVEVDLFKGETRTEEHFARNPDGRVPVLELDSGETIAESAAILLYLGEGTGFMPPPDHRLARARVHQAMFFEQDRIEAELGYARYLKLSGRWESEREVFENRLARGSDALAAFDRLLAARGGEFAAGASYTVADVALYPYVSSAGDAGADPRAHTRVAEWLDRVRETPGFVDDLEPLPTHARERPV